MHVPITQGTVLLRRFATRWCVRCRVMRHTDDYARLVPESALQTGLHTGVRQYVIWNAGPDTFALW